LGGRISNSENKKAPSKQSSEKIEEGTVVRKSEIQFLCCTPESVADPLLKIPKVRNKNFKKKSKIPNPCFEYA